MIVVVAQLVQERARLQDERRQHHLAQVHAGPQLLQQRPQQVLVLVGQLLGLTAAAQKLLGRESGQVRSAAPRDEGQVTSPAAHGEAG